MACAVSLVYPALKFAAMVQARSITGGIEMSDIPSWVRKQALSREMQPTVRIGKAGITDALYDEIKGQLATHSLVKIKINRGLFARDGINEIWAHLAEETSSVVVISRGNVGVLWRS
jgi:RNA-binding protein